MDSDPAAKNHLWKTPGLVHTYIEGVRKGLPCAVEQIDVMLRVIDAGGRIVRRFADLGCGSGILAGAILFKYPAAAGVLVDFSDAMLGEARKQLNRYDDQLKFFNADLSHRDWLRKIEREAPFDAVVSGYAIHHLTDPRKRELYREIFNALDPGGLFINMEHVSSASPWVETISDSLHVDSIYNFHTASGASKSRSEVARELAHRPDQQANMLASAEVQCEWLTQCGFQDVDCYFKIFERAVFGGRRPPS